VSNRWTAPWSRFTADSCGPAGQNFRCETGQETPVTLVRAIRDAGLDNVGVNFDAANLILYGKANPVDAVDILAPYIQGVHAKDGLYPTGPERLCAEVPIGQGKVDFDHAFEFCEGFWHQPEQGGHQTGEVRNQQPRHGSRVLEFQCHDSILYWVGPGTAGKLIT